MTNPQTSIPPAANILGIIGTAAGVFRIWHNWRRKSTEGLPGIMLILWSICGVPFGVYAIVQNFNFALKFQPHAFAGLTLIAWGQTLYYHNKWRAWTAALATVGLVCSYAVVEMILILTFRGPYSRGIRWPMLLMAILASAIQAIGLIPPYFELAKRHGRVIGINFWFLTIDYSGAFFSLMAVVAQRRFDALGASFYIVCMALEMGIFASQAIWLWRMRHIRQEAKKLGISYDQYVARYPSKSIPRCDSQETMVDVEACINPQKSTIFSEAPAFVSDLLEKEDNVAKKVDEQGTQKQDEQDMPQTPEAAYTKS